MEKETIWKKKKKKMKTIVVKIDISRHEPFCFIWYKDAENKIEDCQPFVDFITIFNPYNEEDVEIEVIGPCFAQIHCEKAEKDFKESECDDYRLYGSISFDIPELTHNQLKVLEESDFEIDYYIKFVNSDGVEVKRELDWDYGSNYNVCLEI